MFVKAKLLVLHFSYNLIIFVMALSVMLLSMKMITILTLIRLASQLESDLRTGTGCGLKKLARPTE